MSKYTRLEIIKLLQECLPDDDFPKLAMLRLKKEMPEVYRGMMDALNKKVEENVK